MDEVGGVVPPWTAIRDFARAADGLGIDSVWVYDHFFYDPEDGSPIEGTHEAWTILTAAAAVTERVELGALVLCSNFREPGLVAKMAATLDEVSGGRVILGLGAGWHDPEYDAFGYPTDHKVSRFEEWIEIVVRTSDRGLSAAVLDGLRRALGHDTRAVAFRPSAGALRPGRPGGRVTTISSRGAPPTGEAQRAQGPRPFQAPATRVKETRRCQIAAVRLVLERRSDR